VPSSEPRLTPPSSAASSYELTGGEIRLLKSTVPFATHVLVVGGMLLFFIAATLLTLQAPWQWWIFEYVVAAPVLVVLGQRTLRVQKGRDARHLLEAQLRAGHGGSFGSHDGGNAAGTR